jgi:uncharacterized membrane protein
MNVASWLLLIHVVAATIWIGGGVTVSLIGARARGSDDPLVVRDFSRLLSYLGLRVFTPAVILVLLSGIGIVLADSEWAFTQTWVLLAIAAFVVAFLIGALYLGRSAIHLERLAADPAMSLAAARELLGRWLVGYGVVLLVLLFALWDMVFKPGIG